MSKIVVPVGPLSSNKLWRGGPRYKSKEYLQYEKDLGNTLPNPDAYRIEGPVEMRYRFFVKNHKRADTDNFIKGLQDILVTFGFLRDDCDIYRFTAEKVPVKDAREERIEIEILQHKE